VVDRVELFRSRTALLLVLQSPQQRTTDDRCMSFKKTRLLFQSHYCKGDTSNRYQPMRDRMTVSFPKFPKLFALSYTFFMIQLAANLSFERRMLVVSSGVLTPNSLPLTKKAAGRLDRPAAQFGTRWGRSEVPREERVGSR
jgi:hypothetical protein